MLTMLKTQKIQQQKQRDLCVLLLKRKFILFA